MQIKQIKRGNWYETTQGIGQAERVGGTHPPSVVVRIVRPIPRGIVNMKPRDILNEVPAPETANAKDSPQASDRGS